MNQNSQELGNTLDLTSISSDFISLYLCHFARKVFCHSLPPCPYQVCSVIETLYSFSLILNRLSFKSSFQTYFSIPLIIFVLSKLFPLNECSSWSVFQ